MKKLELKQLIKECLKEMDRDTMGSMYESSENFIEEVNAFLDSPLISKALQLRGVSKESFTDESLFSLAIGTYMYATDYHGGQGTEAYKLHSYLNALKFSPGPAGFKFETLKDEDSEAIDWLIAIGKADGVNIDYDSGEIVEG